ncbi:FAD-binding protein [Myxococcota bacterium]|nr:FAD-binding protein [Myxococcota bacterium]
MTSTTATIPSATELLDRLGSELDLVVVGSGAGSITAALVAKALGKRCVILEKQAKVGGSTAISGGVLWTPCNPLMAEEGIPDSYERARRYFDSVVTYEGPGTSPERREAFLKVGPPMIQFLRARGMRFFRPEGWADYYDDRPGGEPRSRCLMAPLYDARVLGPWAKKLARSPVGAGMPVHSHELPDLYLAKRGWKGKAMALRLGGRMLRSRLTGADLVSNGAAIQGRMLEIALREGIPIVPEAPVRDLVVEGGRVVGVQVALASGERVVRARGAVLLNAGGFSRSQALRERFGPAPTAAQWTAANPGDTGEVLETAMRLGAAVDNLDAFWWVPTTQGLDGQWPEGTSMPDGSLAPWTHHLDLSLPYSIVVDRHGERYVNESASYMEVGERMHERNRTHASAIPSFVVFDGLHRKWYPWGTALPGVTPKSWLDSGYMKKADTLEGLAAACGIDAAGLAKTVERWNGFCRSGVDADFQRGARCFDRAHGDPSVKPNPNLGPISTPPYYAVAMVPSDVGTAGGLVTDAWARVLRGDGSAIDGLYATGNTTASVMGRTYPGAGASIAAAFTFAYIAAHHAFGEARRIDALLGGGATRGGSPA